MGISSFLDRFSTFRTRRLNERCERCSPIGCVRDPRCYTGGMTFMTVSVIASTPALTAGWVQAPGAKWGL